MDLDTYYQFLRYLSDSTVPESYNNTQIRRLKHQTRNLIVREGILYKKNLKNPQRPLKIVKLPERETILFCMHSDPLSGHFNAVTTLHRTSLRYFWPQMGEDIKNYVKSCEVCQRRGKPKTREPLLPIKVGNPFDRVGIDIVGPLPLTARKNRYIVVATEYLTKWPEARAIPAADAANVASFFFEDIICRHGCPKELLSDQGSHFCNKVVDALCQHMNVRHKLSSPYHPQTNGLVERFNRTLCEVLAKCSNQFEADWDHFVPAALFAYRTSQHSTTRHEPFFLLYGRDALLPVETTIHTYPSEPADSINPEESIVRRMENIIGNLEEARIQAQERIARSQQKQQVRHDKNATLETYSIGNLVLLYRSALEKTWSHKLEEKWEGPYFIHETLRNGAYKLRNKEGKVLKRSVHGNRLKLYHSRSEVPTVVVEYTS
jgi:Integrase zinc binding domain/Integrase core domain